MLTDKCPLPENASSAGGSTLQHQRYRVELGHYHYVFHDTVGLNGGTSASTTPRQAPQDLCQFISKIEGGVSLLIYVHRGKILHQNVEDYKHFNAMCENKVPIALIVTGLEEADSFDDWWATNKDLFKKAKMQTDHVACITTTKGKPMEHPYQKAYDESKDRLKKMLLAAPLDKVGMVKASTDLKIFMQKFNLYAPGV